MTSIRTEIRRLTREASPPFTCSVTVDSVTQLSESFVRVGARGPGLSAYRDALPADAFKVFLPPADGGDVTFPERGANGLPYWPDGVQPPVLRPFTVRHFDPDRLRLEFDVALHSSGMAMHWLHAVRVGDVIGLSGMRREFHAGTGVERHLLVGDTTALPAVAAIIESLPPGTSVTAYLAVNHPSDQALLAPTSDVTVHWVPAPRLTQTVRDIERPGGRVQAWIAAEASVVRDVRRLAVDELGVTRDDLHASAYWKHGLDSTQADTVLLKRYKQEIDAGTDVTDPDVRERVELDI